MNQRPKPPEGYDDNPPLDDDFHARARPARHGHAVTGENLPTDEERTAYNFVNLWAAALQLHEQTMRHAASGKVNRSDEYFLRAFSQKSSVSDETLNALLSEYGVARSFPNKNRDFRRITLNCVISFHHTGRDNSLHERAKALLASVTKKTESLGDSVPVSAITKIAWFDSPRGWIIYDSRTKSALGTSNWSAYYRKLDELDATEWLQAVRNSVLKERKDVFAERVLDKALYILGGPDNYKVIARHHSRRALKVGEEISALEESRKLQDFLRDRFGLA